MNKLDKYCESFKRSDLILMFVSFANTSVVFSGQRWLAPHDGKCFILSLRVDQFSPVFFPRQPNQAQSSDRPLGGFFVQWAMNGRCGSRRADIQIPGFDALFPGWAVDCRQNGSWSIEVNSHKLPVRSKLTCHAPASGGYSAKVFRTDFEPPCEFLNINTPK